MPNPKKVELVEQITEKFKKSRGVYFVDYLGMDVEQVNSLRKELRNSNIEYKVLKNTFLRFAADKSGLGEEVKKFFVGPTAVAFSYSDPTVPAKVLTNFIKKNKIKHLKIKGCLFESKVYDQTQIESISKLPNREEILAKFIATIQTPLSNLVATLSSPFNQLIGVLNALKEEKSENVS